MLETLPVWSNVQPGGHDRIEAKHHRTAITLKGGWISPFRGCSSILEDAIL